MMIPGAPWWRWIIGSIEASLDERTERKYGERGARYVHFEAGCAAENLAMQTVDDDTRRSYLKRAHALGREFAPASEAGTAAATGA
jgi:hypothetical protein